MRNEINDRLNGKKRDIFMAHLKCRLYQLRRRKVDEASKPLTTIAKSRFANVFNLHFQFHCLLLLVVPVLPTNEQQ